MTDAPNPSPETAGTQPANAARADKPARQGGRRDRRNPRQGAKPSNQGGPRGLRSHPALEQLAGWYPQLFGAVFLPLKRGIFQDLLEAHPEELEREALKAALAIHTRSSRYLTAVASGQQRHDLQGLPVEPMAPEHVHHALLEVFRRRQGRGGEDLTPKLRQRIVQAFEASGLSREAYAELVRGRDEKANALLDEALAEASAREAKDEALLRAFEASGQTVEAFADMYGLVSRTAAQTLERARQRRPEAAG